MAKPGTQQEDHEIAAVLNGLLEDIAVGSEKERALKQSRAVERDTTSVNEGHTAASKAALHPAITADDAAPQTDSARSNGTAFKQHAGDDAVNLSIAVTDNGVASVDLLPMTADNAAASERSAVAQSDSHPQPSNTNANVPHSTADDQPPITSTYAVKQAALQDEIADMERAIDEGIDMRDDDNDDGDDDVAARATLLTEESLKRAADVIKDADALMTKSDALIPQVHAYDELQSPTQSEHIAVPQTTQSQHDRDAAAQHTAQHGHADEAGVAGEPLVQFPGLLSCDGRDAKGRPVVVVNTAAAPRSALRNTALRYIVGCLQPIVSEGEYVLVLVSHGGDHASTLPVSWLLSAYRSLSRAFRKNVKYIILVNPSFLAKAALAVMRPFVSSKAHKKIVKVKQLELIGSATNEEVTLEHLGEEFRSLVLR